MKQLKIISSLDKLDLKLEIKFLNMVIDYLYHVDTKKLNTKILNESKLSVKDNYKTLYRFLAFNDRQLKNTILDNSKLILKPSKVSSWTTINKIPEVVHELRYDKNNFIKMISKPVKNSEILLDIVATYIYLKNNSKKLRQIYNSSYITKNYYANDHKTNQLN